MEAVSRDVEEVWGTPKEQYRERENVMGGISSYYIKCGSTGWDRRQPAVAGGSVTRPFFTPACEAQEVKLATAHFYPASNPFLALSRSLLPLFAFSSRCLSRELSNESRRGFFGGVLAEFGLVFLTSLGGGASESLVVRFRCIGVRARCSPSVSTSPWRSGVAAAFFALP